MSVGVAIRCCAMSLAILTMQPMMRWATKPAESRITVTGTPSLANRPCAASRAAALVAGVVISVRRLVASNGSRVSMATTRLASSPSCRAVVVASRPSGVTTISASADGALPPSGVTPSAVSSFTVMAWPRSLARLTHTLAGRASGTGFAAGTCFWPSG
ncbi:hypothetical protein D3C81_1361740 [compost metagenome]